MVPVIQIRPVPIVGLQGPRPPAWRPGAVQIRPQNKLGQSTAGIAAAGVIPMLFTAATGAGLAWVGFSTGGREKGFLSILGYVYGVFGVLGAAGGVLGAIAWATGVSLVGEKIEQRRQERQTEPDFSFPEMPDMPTFE